MNLEDEVQRVETAFRARRPRVPNPTPKDEDFIPDWARDPTVERARLRASTRDLERYSYVEVVPYG